MNAINQEDQLYTKENERRVLTLISLALFWKFKVIPSYVVPEFEDDKFLELYWMEDDPALQNLTFIRLTYRGRKTAEKSFKIFRKSLAGGNPWVPIDPFVKENGNQKEEIFYLMHHKRFIEEIESGNGARLVSKYEHRFDLPRG